MIIMMMMTTLIYNLMKEFFLPVHPARYPCDKRCHECHENDEAVVPAMDTSTNIRSVLDCLCRPTASELARKRKVDRSPLRGKKKCRGTCVSDPKSITPQQRVKQFNNDAFQCLTTSYFVWLQGTATPAIFCCC